MIQPVGFFSFEWVVFYFCDCLVFLIQEVRLKSVLLFQKPVLFNALIIWVREFFSAPPKRFHYVLSVLARILRRTLVLENALCMLVAQKKLQNMKPCSTPRNFMDWTTWFDSLNTSIVLQNKGKASINGTMVIVCIVSRKYCPQLSISTKFYGEYLSKSEAAFRFDVNSLHIDLAEPRPNRRVTTSTQR